jgi:ABC-2 type transport system permease protein
MSESMKEAAGTSGSEDRSFSRSRETRPLYWTIRRELWENRSIYIAPLAVAGFAVVGFCFSMIGMPGRRRAVLLLDEVQQRAAITKPYDVVAMMLIAAAFIIGLYYCMEALHGERRDRSILFWKSLPVSDLTTVLAKLTIPLVVLPAFMFVVVLAAQFAMLILSSIVLLANGLNPLTTLTHLRFGQNSLILAWGLVTLALWHAPVYAWLLLLSAWARGAVLLWAILPPVVLSALERIAFGSSQFSSFLHHRLGGGVRRAFALGPDGSVDSLGQLTPGTYLSSPGLWIGLAVAALLVVATIRLRRYREPI